MKLHEGLFPVNIRRPSSGVKLLSGAVSRDVDFISGLAMRRAANVIDFMGLLPQLHDPQNGLGQHMSPVEYRTILKYRLMIPLFPVDARCPVCRKACLDSFEEHAVHCKELSRFKYRHAMVRDVLFDIRRRAGISTKKEAPVNFLTDPSDGRSTLRHADVLVFGWVGGKHACVDLTVFSPLVGLHTSVLNGKSPYDLMYNKPPSLKHLKSFGCSAYATILNSHDKFGSRSEKHGDLPSDYGSTSTFSKENGSFAVDEENNSNFKGNGLHNQSQNNVSQDNNGAQNLKRSFRTVVFPKKFNDFIVDSKVKYGLEKYVNYSYLSKGDYCFATMLNKGVKP
nr:auxilin-like protein [Tanacetum cinerariifolium]